MSSHFLTLAIEVHLVPFRLGASFTFEPHCLLPVTSAVAIICLHMTKYAFLLHLA